MEVTVESVGGISPRPVLISLHVRVQKVEYNNEELRVLCGECAATCVQKAQEGAILRSDCHFENPPRSVGSLAQPSSLTS